MKIISDIWTFLKALRFVDIVFFFAVLILMILILILIYFIMVNKEEEVNDNTSDETAEMKIVKELKENMNSEDVVINFTNYEKDQEEKAIISYDELVSKSNKYDLNYEKEEIDGDLSIKKVDLDNLINKNSNSESKLDVRVISFAKEEAFLQALKQLQKELG